MPDGAQSIELTTGAVIMTGDKEAIFAHIDSQFVPWKDYDEMQKRV
jgi:hypothetical protein